MILCVLEYDGYKKYVIEHSLKLLVHTNNLSLELLKINDKQTSYISIMIEIG
jgi:hypothetical protein